MDKVKGDYQCHDTFVCGGVEEFLYIEGNCRWGFSLRFKIREGVVAVIYCALLFN